MRRNRFCEQFLLKRIPNIYFLKQLEGWGKGQSKQILYLRVFPWRNKSGCPTSKRLGICNHQRKWVVTYQQNLSHLHLHVSPIPFLVVLLSKVQTLGWCLCSNYFTNTNLGHMSSRKTLWRKQSRFNCNGSKSVQQPIRTPANDQRRWKELCFISLFRVAGVSIFFANWIYYKGRFRDFEFFISIWITAFVSLRHILPVSKQVEKISPVISAPVCTYHTHILPYFFPAKFSDTSSLRIIFGLNLNHLGSTATPTLWDLF